MRLREPFTIFPRKMPSGKIVFYYQTYDEGHFRIHARSTGQTSKTRARIWCQEQAKVGSLIPAKEVKRIQTLGEFGASVWQYETSSFLKYRRQRGHVISKSHVENQNRNFIKHIQDTIGVRPLDQVTTPMVEAWFLAFKDGGLSHQSCNHLLFNVRTILGEAARVGIIPVNPAQNVKPLAKDAKTRGILTRDEVNALLSSHGWSTYWPTWYVYLANLTAAVTGLRLGEVLALRWQDLQPFEKPDRIVVTHSWDRKYGLKTTKTGKDRVIPLRPEHKSLLFRFNKTPQPEAFIFSIDSGDSPICDRMITRAFYDALKKLGIDEKARVARNLTFHGLRHFFNTYLRREGVHDSKVQLVTGHATVEMTDHYTHFDIGDLKEVEEAQKGLLAGFGTKKPTIGSPTLDSIAPQAVVSTPSMLEARSD